MQGWLGGSCLETCKACLLPQDENLRGWCNWQINKPIYNISAPAVLFPYLDDQKQWLTFHWHCLKNKMWWHYLDAFVVLVGPNKCWRSRSRLFFFYEGEPRLPISTLPLFLPLDEVDKKQIIVLIGLFTKLHRHLFIRESSNSFQQCSTTMLLMLGLF